MTTILVQPIRWPPIARKRPTPSQRSRYPRSALFRGLRDIVPLTIAAFPFGLVYGVAVADTVISDWLGGLASILVVAGASQLAMVDLLDQGAPWFMVVLTALVINVRFVMYSGALAPSFAEYPRRWRLALAHFMTDQMAATSLLYNERERRPRHRMYYYVGITIPFIGAWLVGTWLGILLGAGIPSGLQLGFAIPLMFTALLVPSLRDRASVVAAMVAGGATLLLSSLPFGTGLLIGACLGIASGMAVRR